MANTLKPCPFCGEKFERAVVSHTVCLNPARYRGYCWGCGAIGPERDTKAQAATAWDSRAI